MGEEEFGFPGFAKSARSFLEALSTLEREAEILFGRIGGSPTGVLAGFLGKVAAVIGSGATGTFDLSAVLRRSGVADTRTLMKSFIALLGVADGSALDVVRDEVREVVEQVARLRERELALAGGVSQLRARAARFEEALAGLARVQGKCVARLDGHVDRARDLERLAARRDDHITRLIRDTAGQRAELERLRDEIAASGRTESEQSVLETRRDVADVRAKVAQIESHYTDLKKLQTGSAQRVIETLESLRDRIGKLESRAAEMSREARAKAGRLDALARHVAVVEARLSTAIGKNGEAIVPATKDVDRPMPAVG